MAKEKPRRIQVDIGGIRERLEQIADKEKRSLASLIRVLIEEALEARGKSADNCPIDAVEQIWLWDTDDLAAEAGIPPERVAAIKKGSSLSGDELIKLARVFKMRPSELKIQLERRVTNGC